MYYFKYFKCLKENINMKKYISYKKEPKITSKNKIKNSGIRLID